jgi:uncharacterized protein (UPF0332 family)
MSDAARLASQFFLRKPKDIPYASYPPSADLITAVAAKLDEAVVISAYSAIVSYAEAVSGLQNSSPSWAIVRLYYSCFYSIRSLLISEGIVPFNGGNEMILDTSGIRFLKGGKSSHHWNWLSITSTRLRGQWYCSTDSQAAYKKLRSHRESVNYTHGFNDPDQHSCLISQGADFLKRFRSYRDDVDFFYTYLDDHLALAYPTKLIFQLDTIMQQRSLVFPNEKLAHLRSLWKFKDRCPLK